MTSRLFRTVAAAFAAIALAGAAAPGDDAADYAVRRRVTAAGDAPLQRLDLPPQILVALRNRDGTDLRVFDGAGRRLPIARAEVSAPPYRRVALPVLPILGGTNDMDVAGLSLRIDDDGRVRVASLDGRVRDGGDTAVLGVLLDARRMEGTVRMLTIQAALPAGQPITFTIEASTDLKDWRTIAERVVYRPTTGTRPETLPLHGETLAGSWLRLSWRADARLLSPVSVRSAALGVISGTAPVKSLAAVLPQPADPHAIEVTLPFSAPLSGITLVPATDGIVPVRVLGRDDPEQPWSVRGEGAASRIAGVARDRMIALSGPTPRLLRIEADPRTEGFPTAPVLRLHFAPSAILFVAGTPPLTLAVGREGASDPFLPLTTLTGRNAPETRVGTAVLDAPDARPVLLNAETGGVNRRNALLWALLVAATGFLGWMAWKLVRQNRVEA
jgi:hypothetical protein